LASIRPARPEDAAGIARVHGDAWRAAYRGLVPDAFLETRGREPDAVERRRRWIENADGIFLVVEKGGEILGFANAGPPREIPPGFDAELSALYVHPDHQRRRLGRRLVLHAVEALHARGHRSLALWVLRDNRGGRAFYESIDGKPVGEQEIEIGGARLVEVAYGWPNLDRLLRLRVRVVPPDPAWAGQFALLRSGLLRILGEEAVAVEHVGSTSVPGLAAKPVVDVTAGLRVFPMHEARKAALVADGWTFDPAVQDIPGRQYFSRGIPFFAHLHACLHGGEFWRSHLVFRDALRARPDLAREYEALKHRLAAEAGDDRLAYLAGKAPFIERVLREAATPAPLP
jgi:hypothetical protein